MEKNFFQSALLFLLVLFFIPEALMAFGFLCTRAERNAKSCYEALANAVRVKKNGQDVAGGRQVELGNIVTTNGLQKNLRETQKRMREIRMKAAKKGCSIPQSNYETISVTTTGVDLRMSN